MEYSELRLKDLDKVDVGSRYGGYLFSEKLDGWHAVWDGKGNLFTKGGMVLPAPSWFLELLPVGIAISGELVLRRQQATNVASLRRESGPLGEARLYACDLPGDRTAPFRERTDKLKKLVAKQCRALKSKCPLRYISQHRITTTRAFMNKFDAIVQCTGEYERDGTCFGEGVVITDPESLYTPGRVTRDTRVKLKRREDVEGVVVGYNERSLSVMFNEKIFKLGIGMTAAQRADMPRYFPLSSLVKFSFRSLGQNGLPKEARLLGQRHMEDMTQVAGFPFPRPKTTCTSSGHGTGSARSKESSKNLGRSSLMKLRKAELLKISNVVDSMTVNYSKKDLVDRILSRANRSQ
jgi:hypothetical protein